MSTPSTRAPCSTETAGHFTEYTLTGHLTSLSFAARLEGMAAPVPTVPAAELTLGPTITNPRVCMIRKSSERRLAGCSAVRPSATDGNRGDPEARASRRRIKAHEMVSLRRYCPDQVIWGR